jgi:capsular polysaccharide biosynthesis protein
VDIDAVRARLRTGLWLILTLAAVGALAAFVFSRLGGQVFRTDARLVVGQALESSQVEYSDLLAGQLLAQVYADLAVTTPVLDAAGRSLTSPLSADVLESVVSARAPVGSIYVVITAEASDGQQAAAIANAVASALEARSPGGAAVELQLRAAYRRSVTAVDGQLVAALDQLAGLLALTSPTPEQTAQIASLRASVETLRAQRAALAAGLVDPGSNLLTIVAPATAPTEPFEPRTLENLVLGGLVGAALGIAFVLFALDGGALWRRPPDSDQP